MDAINKAARAGARCLAWPWAWAWESSFSEQINNLLSLGGCGAARCQVVISLVQGLTLPAVAAGARWSPLEPAGARWSWRSPPGSYWLCAASSSFGIPRNI